MDTIFFNGCIRTLDDSEKVAEAVGIENGRIVFVGTDKEAEAFSCKKRIDLKGRLMLPGFVDTHMHMLHYAFVERSVKLFDCTSVEEMLAAAKKRLEESKGQKLTWLYCRGWNEEHFDKPRYPHKDELDALSTEIPIIMVRVCGHVAVCNSCGLELLKKIPEFPEIEKEVDLDTGLLKENAVQFYSSVLEAPSQEEVEGYIRYSAKKLNECGFTGVQSDDLASLPGKNWRRIMASYKALDARGELSIRHYEQCLFERAEDAKAFIEEGYRTGQRGDHFTVGPMKLIQDGSLGARTAAMNEPYEDAPGNTGIITFSQEELDDLFRKNFPTECDMIDTFLFKFHKATMEQCEIVATLYAVWNNRIIRQQEITDELLKADFLAWDPHKYKYRDRVMKALIWMRKENIIPVGWGDIVE